jgi:hypothetical protein
MKLHYTAHVKMWSRRVPKGVGRITNSREIAWMRYELAEAASSEPKKGRIEKPADLPMTMVSIRRG